MVLRPWVWSLKEDSTKAWDLDPWANVPWVNSFYPQVLLCHSSLVIVFPLPRQLDFGLTRE